MKTAALSPGSLPSPDERVREDEARKIENNCEALSRWVGVFLQHESFIDSLYGYIVPKVLADYVGRRL